MDAIRSYPAWIMVAAAVSLVMAILFVASCRRRATRSRRRPRRGRSRAVRIGMRSPDLAMFFVDQKLNRRFTVRLIRSSEIA